MSFDDDNDTPVMERNEDYGDSSEFAYVVSYVYGAAAHTPVPPSPALMFATMENKPNATAFHEQPSPHSRGNKGIHSLSGLSLVSQSGEASTAGKIILDWTADGVNYSTSSSLRP